MNIRAKKIRKIMILLSLSSLLFTLCACNKSDSTKKQAAKNETEISSETVTTEFETTTESTEGSEIADFSTEKATISTEKKESTESEPQEKTPTKEEANSYKPVNSSGKFQGFADNNSIEILLDDGNYEVFLVEDSKLLSKLDTLDDGEEIEFTYTLKEGQANKLITSIK